MYDAKQIRSFYDAYAEREWNRHERRAHDRVSVYIHTHYLERFIRPGMRVLDAGAGPGKYTLELLRLGARVVAGDISPIQLELHRQRTEGATGPGTIESRDLLDITNLAAYPDGSFDATVCYGGPLSYTYERTGDALAELLRVTIPGGPVLLSVMCLWGAFRMGFADISTRLIPALGVEVGVLEVLRSGNTTSQISGHPMHMFRWSELQDMLIQLPCQIEVVSAVNSFTVQAAEALAEAHQDPVLWGQILEWELESCAQPGNIEGGTHMLVVVRKTHWSRGFRRP